MSLRANIDHLAAAQGIEAVTVDVHGDAQFRGAPKWQAVLDGALSLLRLTQEKTIRIVVGDHTAVVQTEGEETVAVVLPTGHPIAKSLRRMIRRMAKKDRGPIRAAPERTVQNGPPAANRPNPANPSPTPSWPR